MRGGQVVRLKQGDFNRETVYGNDPAQMAETFLRAGAIWVHVVDLDGARTGNAQNLAAVEAMAKLGLSVQLGGGIRNLDDVKRRMDMGIARCIIGTAAVEDPAMVEKACAAYPGHIVVGIDAKEGLVALRGWEGESAITAEDLALSMKALGVETVIHTDIGRDGMGNGPNTAASEKLAAQSGLAVIVSGGVGSLDDLIGVKDAGLPGVILGKAYYDGKIKLEEALALA